MASQAVESVLAGIQGQQLLSHGLTRSGIDMDIEVGEPDAGTFSPSIQHDEREGLTGSHAKRLRFTASPIYCEADLGRKLLLGGR